MINLNKRKILIIHLSGIGNSIMMYPLLFSLNKSKKNDEIHILFKDKVACELLNSTKNINKVFIYQNSKNPILKFIKRLFLISPLLFSNFDYIINTEIKQSFMNQFLMIILRSKNKIFVNNSFGCSIKYDERKSEIDLYKKIGKILKINWYMPTKPFFDNAKTEFCETIHSFKTKKIGIHVGSGENMIFKRWPDQSFSKLLSIIEMKRNCLVLFFGGKEEIEIVNRVINASKIKKFFNFCGKFNILDTAKIISNCDVFVSNDSGLLHLASSMGVPVIGIYGPTSLTKNKPFGTQNILIHEGPCKKESNYMCLKCELNFKKYQETPLCLRRVKADKVLKYI